MKQPMKKGSFVPKSVPGVGWGGGGHYSTEYHNKYTCVTFIWIHFGNNDRIVGFLTVIHQQMTGPNDPDKCTDLWQNSLIINHVAFRNIFLFWRRWWSSNNQG